MRIISGFHEYYDPISKHDHDRETLYIRKTVEKSVSIGFPKYYFASDINFSVLFFCGVPYKRVVLSKFNNYASVWIRSSCLNYQACEEWFRANRDAATFARSSYGPLRDFFEWKVENAYPATPIWFAQKIKASLTQG